MVYRQMKMRQEPKFSFTEKLFLSTKRRHRALGQTILLTKLLAKSVGIVILIFGTAGAATGLCGLFLYGVGSGLEYLVGQKYITTAQAVAGVFVILVSALLIPTIVIIIKSMMKENKIQMKRSIANKMGAELEEE